MIGALSLPFLFALILIGIAINGWLIYKPGSQGRSEGIRLEPLQARRRKLKKSAIVSDKA